jgi:hypothetical protein
LFDALKAAQRESGYARVIGRARAAQALGVLCASLCAAGVARIGYPAALAGSLASIALAVLAALSLPAAEPVRLAHGQSRLAQLRQGLGLTASHRMVLHIVVFSAITASLWRSARRLRSYGRSLA